MNAVTVITVSPEELQRMIDRSVRGAMKAAQLSDTALMGVGDVAKRLGVSTGTVRNMEKAGKLPARCGTKWLRADIERMAASLG